MESGTKRSGAILLTIIFIVMVSSGSEASISQNGLTVEGIPEDGVLENPLNATVTIDNADPSNWTVEWILDGEIVDEDRHIQRYIYPGIHNLTIRAESDDGEIRTASFLLDPIPPPGWGEEVDQKRNDLIFWLIFGSGGLIFGLAALWLWIGKDKTRIKE